MNALISFFTDNNARKHAREEGVPLPPNWIDPRSSAPWFPGWRNLAPCATAKPVAAPQTWLLREGWRISEISAFKIALPS